MARPTTIITLVRRIGAPQKMKVNNRSKYFSNIENSYCEIGLFP